MNNKVLSVVILSATLAYSSPVWADGNAADLLTGDVRLACEAILCLSSGERPDECAPSIRRYFSIKHKKLSDTLKARRNFLNLCPSSKEKGMGSLLQALVNGAGRCDAAELNRMMKRTYREKVCYSSMSRYYENNCTVVTKTYIANGKPAYCSAYFDHEWTTAGDKVKFLGTEKKGGKWVNVK